MIQQFPCLKNLRLSDNLKFYLVAIIASVIFSYIAIIQGSIVNEDAIVYFRAAEAFFLGDWHTAHSIYAWPFYSLLMYLGHGVTGLSLEHVAYVLSSIFYVVILLSFSAIVKVLGFEKKLVWLTIPIILLFPALNDYRGYIVRDAGFYAFYVMSLYWMLVYLKQDKKRALFGWLLSLVIATLFRIEGAVYIASVPIVLLFCRNNWKQRLQDIVILGVPLFLVVSLAVGAVALYFGADFFEKNLWRLYELKSIFTEHIPQLPKLFIEKSAVIQSQILHASVTPQDSAIFLIIGLSGYYIAELFSTVNVIFIILISAGFLMWRRYSYNDTDMQGSKNLMHMVFGYAVIGFLITYTFTWLSFFVNARYLIPMCLPLLVLAVPGTQYFIAKLKMFNSSARIGKHSFVLLLVVYLICSGGMRFGHSRDYIYNAGQWVDSQFSGTNGPNRHLRIYSNNRQLMYYSHLYSITSPEWDQFTVPVIHYSALKLLQHAQLRNYDVLLVLVYRSDKPIVDAMLKNLPFHEIKKFSNNRGDAVVILQK